MLIIERKNGIVRLSKYQLTPVFRRALSDELTLIPVGIWSIGLVQLESCVIDCLTVLIDLLDLGRRQRGEIELKRHIRCARAALQIKEAQLVLGAVEEGVAGEVGGICAGGFELCLDVGFFDFLLVSIRTVDMTDFYFTVSEVDLKRCLLMNAAQIAHEHAVDVNPHVIVARELKDHVIVIGGLAARRLDKLRGHGHAKVVIELIVRSVRYSYRRELTVLLFKNLVGRVKGEELAQIGFAIRIALIYARLIVDVKGVSRGVIYGIVAVRTIRVVNVIAILELEKALHVVVDGLAILLAVGLTVVVKEIGQRLIGVVNTLALGGVGAIVDCRIAIHQHGLHK